MVGTEANRGCTWLKTKSLQKEVRRGKCTFVHKVQVAQAKGADAVVIVDSEDSTRTPEDIQNIIVRAHGGRHPGSRKAISGSNSLN